MFRPTIVSLLVGVGLSAACETPPAPTPAATEAPAAAASAPVAGPAPAAPPPASSWPLVAPDPATIPEGPLGDAIRRGRQLVDQTGQELPGNVGNDLRCSSCHLQGGTVAKAGPWVGITGMFPEHRARNASVNTIEDRINDCFERSLNGAALADDSPDLTAMVAYMTWLSQGVPVGVPIEGRGFSRIADQPAPDAANGERLYAEKCAVCHGAEGQGLAGPNGAVVYPPLWGERSFNIGAGMARLDTAAAFVRWNMPLGQGGTLSDQESTDLAAWFTAQPRPDFAGKSGDWPKGGKPRDARY